jgi:hypothetical protein
MLMARIAASPPAAAAQPDKNGSNGLDGKVNRWTIKNYIIISII